MVLQALVDYYETLTSKGVIESASLGKVKAKFALEISEDGDLQHIRPLPNNFSALVPIVVRTSGISPKYVCDNTSYFLGLDNTEGLSEREALKKEIRAKNSFLASKAMHMKLLGGINTPAARAVYNFFDKWDPSIAEACPAYLEFKKDLLAQPNLVFSVSGALAHDDPEIKAAFEGNSSDSDKSICLVTGERSEPVRIHNPIKGIWGSHSTGASLVSFNFEASESYGHIKGENAPISKYAAEAYVAALNHLLADARYVSHIGNVSIVCWAKCGDESYQEIFCQAAEPTLDTQDSVESVFNALSNGEKLDGIDYDAPFFVLGLNPNVRRASVCFFVHDSFGNILNNLRAHHELMDITRLETKSETDNRRYFGLSWLFQGRPAMDFNNPGLVGSAYRNILSGDKYPYALYTNMLSFIKIGDNLDNYTLVKLCAAFMKAYHIRNLGLDMHFALDENNRIPAYLLGRLFNVLKSYFKITGMTSEHFCGTYFLRACATPDKIFPVLIKQKK